MFIHIVHSKKIIPIFLICLASLMATLNTANAGFLDNLKSTFGLNDEAQTKSAASALLSNDEIAAGLKDALANGAQRAVSELGRDGGFLTNPDVKIPIPDKLETIAKGLRAIGKGDMADQFELSMNHAAEKAVPMAADVFADTISNMSIEDAVGVLKGGENAATDYLRHHTTDTLKERFRPIVDAAIEQVGVTKTYQDFVGSNQMLSGFLGESDLDLTTYVTEQGLDGVFHMIALEEARIRENPAARTTEILKKVFGAGP